MTVMDALQVVAEPHRREILRLVWDEELAAGDIAERFDISFGAVSQHLSVLRDAGFVRVRREGKRRFYQADMDGLGSLKQLLEGMWSSQIERLALLAERAELAQHSSEMPQS
ncbi:MAG TPA: metalloregulator ArsR/SmtB family transcription factor [Chloroflexota bacterium]